MSKNRQAYPFRIVSLPELKPAGPEPIQGMEGLNEFRGQDLGDNDSTSAIRNAQRNVGGDGTKIVNGERLAEGKHEPGWNAGEVDYGYYDGNNGISLRPDYNRDILDDETRPEM